MLLGGMLAAQRSLFNAGENRRCFNISRHSLPTFEMGSAKTMKNQKCHNWGSHQDDYHPPPCSLLNLSCDTFDSYLPPQADNVAANVLARGTRTTDTEREPPETHETVHQHRAVATLVKGKNNGGCLSSFALGGPQQTQRWPLLTQMSKIVLGNKKQEMKKRRPWHSRAPPNNQVNKRMRKAHALSFPTNS